MSQSFTPPLFFPPDQTLEMVKTLPRPLKVKLEKIPIVSDASQGLCYTRKDMYYEAPSALSNWAQQYFVIGGAVAKPNVLQVHSCFTFSDFRHLKFRRLLSLSLSFPFF